MAAINDVTANELRGLLGKLQGDNVLCSAVDSGRLSVVSTGNDLPTIDLRAVSHELQEQSEGVDLVILEGMNYLHVALEAAIAPLYLVAPFVYFALLLGMGRAIETNLFTALTVDCCNLGMIKHHEVSRARDVALSKG